MPSIYTSGSPNIVHHTNGSNALPRFKTTTRLQTTSRMLYGTPKVYTTATTAPKRLSAVAIVFIVLAVIVFFIILGVAIHYIFRRWKRHKQPLITAIPTPSITPAIPAVSFVKNPVKPASQPPSKPQAVLPSLQCRQPLCRDYLRKLNLPQAYFADQYDTCYCRKCHDPANTDTNCGNWCTQLHGWIRFGLRLSEVHKKQWNIFKEWKTSYYGTSPNRLSSILNNRFVPLDGDTLANNTTFHSGHPDQTHCTTSSSLACASQPKFSVRSNFRAIDGNNYYVQVVLQCKQEPGTITVKEEAKSYKNVEWKTKARCSVVPFGLLIRLQRM